MLWAKKPTLDEIQETCRNTLCDQLGMKFTNIGEDFLEATMPVDQKTIQPAGILHGGASVALAETLGSIASLLCLKSKNKMPVGLEINANHLKAVKSGHVIGRVTSIRRGKTVHVWNIEIKNENGDLCCVSRLTVLIIDTI